MSRYILGNRRPIGGMEAAEGTVFLMQVLSTGRNCNITRMEVGFLGRKVEIFKVAGRNEADLGKFYGNETGLEIAPQSQFR
jgi:hypothetical protein